MVWSSTACMSLVERERPWVLPPAPCCHRGGKMPLESLGGRDSSVRQEAGVLGQREGEGGHLLLCSVTVLPAQGLPRTLCSEWGLRAWVSFLHLLSN